ncbi:hypothetical protein L1049_027074 [Liquidambar formosana]|uniref:Cellulose synthase n=1 Tax=Liquidambar formosana TaxID=63359 RepID=A0AAP0N4N3_LIQFO
MAGALAAGLKENGELFVACGECGFPVCRPCYEYERSEGNQCCPQCNTRYKRHKGCPRIEGDDGGDDSDDEFHNESHHYTQNERINEDGDYNQPQWHLNGDYKNFEGEETYNSAEWKEKVEKWKTRQEKRGLASKDDGGNYNCEEDNFLHHPPSHHPLLLPPFSHTNSSTRRLPFMAPLCNLRNMVRTLLDTRPIPQMVPHQSRNFPGPPLHEKIDYLKDKVQTTFVKDRRAMKREYEEFKVRINALVANAQKKPDEGWVMQDGTPWPGNNTGDHPGMIQVRVSGVLTNAPFMLNLDCDHYIYNSKAIREAMCFLMDPQLGKRLCYVQFPQRFNGIDRNDRYANRNTVFFDVNMKGLDGIQGPVYIGTGCVFNRQALYGYDPPASEKRLKMTWINTTSLIEEAIHVISCGYEEKTEWGKELTGLVSIWIMALFLCIITTGVLEILWSGVSIDDWWRNEQFWVIGGVSSHLFAVFQGLLKVLAGVDTKFTVTSKAALDTEFRELYLFKWTALLIPPTTLIILNIFGVVAGISDAITNGDGSWGPLFGKIFFAAWVIIHLYPFLKGLMGRQNRTPTIIVLWSILLASILSLVWVRIDPFLPKNTGPILKPCGVEC